MAVAHYLEALAWQRDVVKLHAIFGGKNPHPNFVVGGTPAAISVHTTGGQGKGPMHRGGQDATAVNMLGLQTVQTVIKQMRDFVDQVYIPDLLAIASFYKDWGAIGDSGGNYLSFGDMPEKDMWTPESFLIPRGVILGGDISKVHPINLDDDNEIQEFVNHAWYKYKAGDDKGLHPWKGETEFNYTGPKPPYEHLDVDQKYSWLKSPRWKGKPMEVGPLARALIMYATGNKQMKELVDYTLKTLDVPVTALFSTLGRTAARGLESKVLADAMQGMFDKLLANIKGGDVRTFNDQYWDPSSWPKSMHGVGLMEAPRGGLSHWIVIEDGKIDNYQAIVPSTWNAGPRDTAGPVRTLRGVVAAQPRDARSQAAPGDPAHHPQLRSLPGLCRACDRSGRRGTGSGESEVRRPFLPGRGREGRCDMRVERKQAVATPHAVGKTYGWGGWKMPIFHPNDPEYCEYGCPICTRARNGEFPGPSPSRRPNWP
jgi:hydrogenase large subunit